ncbi:MAG TPA: fumarate reductase subunit FrdD [Gemmataceae bacterium]|jgi:fumarate reductase subunit D|nr:fumarate reductase subunit FrdD [Gemmataceae bacterium]
MARSNEPLWWVPFMAGAGISAFLMPATIFVTAIAVGLGWIDESGLRRLLSNPLVRVYLVVLISLSLFHAAHRLRFVLIDLLTARGALSLICYGTAIVGTLAAILIAVMG